MIEFSTFSRVTKRVAAMAAGVSIAASSLFGSVNFAQAAALTGTSVTPASLVAGAASTVTVAFTTVTTMQNNWKVKITFPTGFNVSTIQAPLLCTGFDGSTSFGTAGQVVTITRTGGTAFSAGAVSCTLPNITNPGVAGAMGTFTISTTDNSDVVQDTNAAVAGVTITPGALTSTNVQPASTRISTTGAVTVSFTTANSLENNGYVKIDFPSGFNVSGATGGTCSTMDGGFTTSVALQSVSIIRNSAGTSEPAGAQICTLSGIRNPVTAGSGGTYSIETDNSANAIHDRDLAVAADNFSATSSSSSSTTPAAATYSVTVSAPAATAVFMPGDDVAIGWSTGGTGAISAINLSYSVDGGLNWSSIVTGTANDGAYTWTAPSISAQSVTIRAQGTDLVTVLATDDSDAFSIGTNDDESNSSEDASDDNSGSNTTLLPEGTFMKGASWSTVYYIDADGTRRPFLDSQTFYTYADNFDGVVDVSDEYLSNFTIGTPMLPKAGTVLVKIQSVDKVYALGDNGELHWLSSESVAKALYGSNWADYVIDVPATAWSHFTIGADISSASDWTVDTSLLQTRSELNSK